MRYPVLFLLGPVCMLMCLRFRWRWCERVRLGRRIVWEVIGLMRLLTLGVGEWNWRLSMPGVTFLVSDLSYCGEQ